MLGPVVFLFLTVYLFPWTLQATADCVSISWIGERSKRFTGGILVALPRLPTNNHRIWLADIDGIRKKKKKLKGGKTRKEKKKKTCFLIFPPFFLNGKEKNKSCVGYGSYRHHPSWRPYNMRAKGKN